MSLVITCILVEELDFEIDHFCNFWTSVTLILDRDIGSYLHISLINLYLHSKFHLNRKNLLWMDRRTDIKSGFIRSSRSSQPKKHHFEYNAKPIRVLNLQEIIACCNSNIEIDLQKDSLFCFENGKNMLVDS